MADSREFKIIIKADGSAAVSALNQVSSSMKHMEGQSSGIISKLKGSFGSFVSEVIPMLGQISIASPFVAIAESIRRTTHEGSEFLKISNQIGISVENISALKYAAELSETSIEDLTTGIGILSKNLHGMDEESKLSSRAIKALGIDIDSMKDSHEIFIALADAFAKMEEGADKTAFAMEIFGRSGKALLPLLNEGGDRIREMEAEAKRLGITFTEDSAKAADQFGDNIVRLTSQLKGFAFEIGNVVIPYLNQLLDLMSSSDNATKLYKQLADLEEEMGLIKSRTEFFDSFGLSAFVKGDNENLQKMYKERQAILDKLWDLQAPKGTITKTPAPPLPGKDTTKTGSTGKSAADELDDLSRAVETYQQKLIDLNPTLTESDKKFMQWEDTVNELMDKIDQAKKLPEDIKQGLKDEALQIWGQGVDFMSAADERKMLDQVQAIETRIRSLRATSRQQELLDLDTWMRAEIDKYKDNYDALIMLQEEYDIKKAEIIRKHGTEDSLAFLENMEGLVPAFEEATKVTEIWGETTEENLKRVVDKENEWLPILEYAKTLLEENGRAGTKAYEDISDAIQQVKNDQAELNKTFGQGFDKGMEEYLDTLEWGFDRGKELSREAFTSMESFFEDLFVGKIKLSLNDLLGFAGGISAKFASQLTTGSFANMLSPGSVNLAQLLPAGLGGLESLIPLLGPGAMGLLGGQLMGGGLGSSLGGLTGGILGGTSLYGTGVGAMYGLLGAGAASLPLNFIIPGLGALLGAAIGAALDDILGEETVQQKFKVKGGQVETYGDLSEKKEDELVRDVLQPAYDAFVEWAGNMGMQTQDLFDMSKWGLEDQEKITAKELMNKFYRGLLEAAGMDTEIFKPFQKEGEKYYETIVRVMQALGEGIPEAMESIENYIDAIKGSDDQIAMFIDQLQDMEDNIADIEESLDKATDPSDALTYAEQLKQAIYDKYIYEKQLIEGLVADIRALEIEMVNWTISMQQKIDGLTGRFDSVGMMWSRFTSIMDQVEGGSLSASDSLSLLKEGVGWLDQWVAANVEAIQQQYESQRTAIELQIEAINLEIDALNKKKEYINEEISGLQEQLSLSKSWKSVLDSVNQSIRDMKTQFSQRDDLEQLDYMRGEIDAMFAKYQGATGEEKIDYASQLQSLIQQYLTQAAETLQLPSLAYGEVYDDMLAILETIQGDAIEGAATQEDILAQIEALQQESNAIDEEIAERQNEIAGLNQQMVGLNEQMQADIQAFKESAVVYYEWAMNEGAALYEEQKRILEEKLGEIVGDLGVEGYLALKQEEAVNKLEEIRLLLEDIKTSFGDIPQSAEGRYVTSPMLTWVGEKGPEYIVPAGNVNTGSSVTVNLALPSITINAGDKANPMAIARTTEDYIIRSARGGRLRQVIRDAARGK